MKTIIFYFSATGNSFSIARAIAAELGNTTLAPLMQAEKYSPAEYDMAGIVLPVYYTHAPMIALGALRAIDFSRYAQVFAIAACGSSQGYALEDIRMALNAPHIVFQGYQVKMPGNYILEYSAFPEAWQRRILSRAEKRVRKIAQGIAKNEKTKPLKPNLLARLYRKRADEKIKSFAEMGTRFFATEKCSGCLTCVRLCPAENITASEGGLVWGSQCAQCMACVQWCPKAAIAHPMLLKGRRRYTHPHVAAEQLMAREEEVKGVDL